MGIVPISGSSNAGVSFVGLTAHKLTDHITLGVALGLLFGKLVGVFGSAFLTLRLGLADFRREPGCSSCGVSPSCAVGLTMSLFIPACPLRRGRPGPLSDRDGRDADLKLA